MLITSLFVYWFYFTATHVAAQLRNNGTFPKNFQFGVGGSAYQSEGAWDVDGKGMNIWDTFVRKIPSPIRNGDNGDTASNSYYRYKEDIRLAAALGVKLYKFSISYARILPTGYSNLINQKGIDHYKSVVQEIRNNNMIPLAVIYHWDIPQRLFDDGFHWANRSFVPHLVNYSRIVIKNLPDVGIWITINEPKQICHWGYGTGYMAPGIKSDGLLEYQCSYNILRAHSAIYHMYKKEFPQYQAKMAMTIDCQWIEPLTNSIQDEIAADRQRQFECGLYLHPIYVGDWPPIVKNRIDERSAAANFSVSRLPAFTNEEIARIKGSQDFLALNHYYTFLARDEKEAPLGETSYEDDVGVADSFDPSWRVQANGLFVTVPFGVRKVLNWLKDQYGSPTILITEVGMCDNGTYLNDTDRIDFLTDYFCNILEAMNDGVDVIGITVWSLLDDFEWMFGYIAHFGFYQIDFKDPTLTRRPKESVKFFQQLVRNKQLQCDKPRRNWPGPIRLPGLPPSSQLAQLPKSAPPRSHVPWTQKT